MKKLKQVVDEIEKGQRYIAVDYWLFSNENRLVLMFDFLHMNGYHLSTIDSTLGLIYNAIFEKDKDK